MATRRKKATRKSQGTPAWMWLATGILIGLGLAYYLFGKGYIPQGEIKPTETAAANADDNDELAPAHSSDNAGSSRYDFFTVLPEMEVVVPEQELQRQRERAAIARPDDTIESVDPTERYILQAGSFRENADAEKLRARLALLGLSTQTQTVTVNGATWHRVLVGPVNGAARANEVRDQLSSNGIESMVTRSQ